MSDIIINTIPQYIKTWVRKHCPQYLTIEALDDDVNVNIYNNGYDPLTGTFEVRLNNGNWTSILWESIGSRTNFNIINAVSTNVTLSKNDKLQFRNIAKWSTHYNKAVSLRITGTKASVYGKLSDSLTPDLVTSMQEYKLAYFFQKSSALIDASNLDLSDIVLSDLCFSSMFSSCTTLVSAPSILPATILARQCYDSMFYYCYALTNPPELPATIATQACYTKMFGWCTSLKVAPKMPATTLAPACYNSMFLRCTSLIQIPDLPATTLAENCYMQMFNGCTSLNSIQKIIATTPANNCYTSMFINCNSITEIHYPKSFETNNIFKNMPTSPKFGATNATAYFDL